MVRKQRKEGDVPCVGRLVEDEESMSWLKLLLRLVFVLHSVL